MDLVFSDEQLALRSTLRQFLEKNSPESEVRRLMESDEGCDPVVWKHLSGELGLTALSIPEEFGGLGFGAVETGVVFEEMGRALYPGPYFSTVALATNLILASEDRRAMCDYLPRIASGELTATVALLEESGRLGEAEVAATADGAGEFHYLVGEKHFVVDGLSADLVIVIARAADGIGLFAVDGTAAGMIRTAQETIDLTRRQAILRFDRVRARRLGTEGAGWSPISEMLDRAAVALALEQVGGASRALEMAVSYAKTRHQFGRPIGSFQAIKHKCADMMVEVESARSAAYYAMWAAAGTSDDLPVVASLAKAYCSEAYHTTAAANIQIHGGIGFTWEHPAHLYFKRAVTSEVLFGDPAHHRELVAQRMGI